MPPLLLQLWREQHPKGHEQKQLDFQIEEACGEACPALQRRNRLGPVVGAS